MNASSQPTQSFTPARVAEPVRDALALADDHDFAIGCECANPVLQIDVWGREAAAQPLQS
ncbi:hypothetical protein [Ramlibacter sp. PS4R-6]|uniref:hypothetical protein n=1 Tax=Ramlibacter sp. PS4R-6 TaxID=3133438 RepID=UPI00309783B8